MRETTTQTNNGMQLGIEAEMHLHALAIQLHK